MGRVGVGLDGFCVYVELSMLVVTGFQMQFQIVRGVKGRESHPLLFLCDLFIRNVPEYPLSIQRGRGEKTPYFLT
jgi:hypothetical protein